MAPSPTPVELISAEPFFWRENQQFELIVDGDNYFPAMLKSIDNAKSHILMEMYLVQSGVVTSNFVDAFVRAQNRGCIVCLLLDGFGSRKLVAQDRKRLVDAGIHLAIFNPFQFQIFSKAFRNNLMRTHRKILVVDGKVAFVGGTGLSDSFVGVNAWRDCMLKIGGETVSDWQNLFSLNFRRWSEHIHIPDAQPATFRHGGRGRVVYTSGGTHLPLKGILLNRIQHSQNRIWFASAYFIPSRKIRRALRRAASRGIDVRLLLPGPITDHPAVRQASRRYYSRLLRHGVRIFEYQTRFLHTKMVIVDDWYTIGSSNMDRWNFRWNLEANQEVDDLQLNTATKDMLVADFNQSEELHYLLWLQRSRLQRFKEWLWGNIDRWLSRRH